MCTFINAMNSLLPGFTVVKQLGQGSYGTVYKVVRQSDNKPYALKCVEMGQLNQRQKEDSVNEIRIMASVSSPFIIAFHEASVIGRRLNIVSEYAKLGDLAHCIIRRKQKKRPFKEDFIWRFFLQMLEGLRVLHDRGIVHRDLKSANILLSAPDLFKIGDLGISTVLSQRQLAKTQIGTPMYLAPEIWRHKPYNSKCDIWSLGVLLYEMATFQYPYNARNARDLSVKVCSLKPPRISNYSKELVTIINRMLSHSPSQRPSARDLLNNPVVKSKMYLIAHFLPAAESAHANLLETIKVPRNLQSLNLPRPQYENEDVGLAPMEERLHIKNERMINPKAKVNLCSTRDLQKIVDLDCWSPVKAPRTLRQLPPIIDSSSEHEDPEDSASDDVILFPPRQPDEPKVAEISEPKRPRTSAPRKISQPLPKPAVEPKSRQQIAPPRIIRFRYRVPFVIR